MKTLLSALAVVLALGAVTVPANAACWGTPWGMRCSHPYWHHGGYWHHQWRNGW